MCMRRLAMVLCLAVCGPSALAAPNGAAVSTLPTVLAKVEPVAQHWVFDGVLEAAQRSTVSAQTSGRVLEVKFDVDDFVHQGDVIVRFSDAEQRARLAAAKANVSGGRARLIQAQKEYDRTKRIFARKLVAKSAMDKATAELNAAKARASAAEAGLQEAQEQLDHTVVRAPYSGIVVQRLVEVGEAVRAGTPLMTGLSLEHLRAVVELPQNLIEKVRAIGKAYLVMPGASARRVEADKLVIFPYADPVSHTFKVRVNLPAGIKGLFPGMLVKIGFVTGETRGLLVPARAIVHRSEVTGVYVVDADGKLSLRQIRLGERRANGMFEVLAGLQPGERVALDPIRAGVMLKEQWSKGRS